MGIYLFAKNFGIITMFKTLILPKFAKDSESRARQKNKAIYNYLKKTFKNIIAEYTNLPIKESSIETTAPIWVCWWQGEENMPQVVKICYNSIIRNANNHPVHLITFDNYMQYVTIPPKIVQQQKIGHISLTHLSDVLRVSLLEKYGGIWIDSTIFVTAPIDLKKYTTFFSPKLEKKDDFFFSDYRWSTFLLGCGQNNLLFSFVKKTFDEYFRKKSIMIDYFFLDCCISIAYHNLGVIKQDIDKLPYNNCEIYSLANLLNQPYSVDIYNTLLLKNSFHKLSWKNEYFPYTSDNKLTFYGHLINEYETYLQQHHNISKNQS